MKFIAIIQARCGSSRLPGKILIDICGKPVLQRVIERVQKSKYVEEVIVATSITHDNLPVMALCANLGVRVFAGAEHDVLDRYYQVAKLLMPEYIVRVTADCPCYDWDILDAAIDAMHLETDYLCSSNETLPDGLDIEIMKFSVLEKAWNEAKLSSEREHVTLFIHNNSKDFVIQKLDSPCGNNGHIRLTLDEDSDLLLIRQVYERLHEAKNHDFLTTDILQLLESHPDLLKINEHITRNEGLLKSLQDDRRI